MTFLIVFGYLSIQVIYFYLFFSICSLKKINEELFQLRLFITLVLMLGLATSFGFHGDINKALSVPILLPIVVFTILDYVAIIFAKYWMHEIDTAEKYYIALDHLKLMCLSTIVGTNVIIGLAMSILMTF